jgi:type IV secretion system protein VirD4
MNRVTIKDGRPNLPLKELSRFRFIFGALIGALLVGALTWTIFWYIFHKGDILTAILHPWQAPWAALRWPSSTPFDPKLKIAGFVAGAVTLIMLAGAFAPRAKAIYGDARFARSTEIKHMGLLALKGIILGKLGLFSPRFLRYNGDGHILLVAPTRSGKGVGIVMPNLLSYPQSVVVLDLKKELFHTTSGFRQHHGQKVFVFSPSDPNKQTCCFNPLDAVRRDKERRIGDLQTIGHLLIAEGTGENKMWTQEARSLFVGLALYAMDMDEPLTFGQIMRMLQTNADLGAAFKQVIKEHGDRLDYACINILANFANKSDKERSGVKSGLTGALELWNDPLIDNATSRSDFSFDELRRTSTTIYFAIAQDELERLSFLINMFFQQLVGVVARRQPGKDEPYQVLALIDEFASLGRMDLLVEKLPFMAGFNFRMMFVIQGLAQLDRLYGPAGREIILQNAAIQIFFASNDVQTTEYISERLGTFTETQKTRSRSSPIGFGGSHGTGSVSTSTNYYARELMKPEEVRRLSRSKAIIFAENERPVMARKVIYYKDKAFMGRVQPSIKVKPIAITFHKPYLFNARSDNDVPNLPMEELWADAEPHLTDDELAELREYAAQMPSLQARLPGLLPEDSAPPMEIDDHPTDSDLEPALRLAPADHPAADALPSGDGDVADFTSLLVKSVADGKHGRKAKRAAQGSLKLTVDAPRGKTPLGHSTIK